MKLNDVQERKFLRAVPTLLKKPYSLDLAFRAFLVRAFGSTFLWKPFGDYQHHNSSICAAQANEFYRSIGIHVGGTLPTDFYTEDCISVNSVEDGNEYASELITQLLIQDVLPN